MPIATATVTTTAATKRGARARKLRLNREPSAQPSSNCAPLSNYPRHRRRAHARNRQRNRYHERAQHEGIGNFSSRQQQAGGRRHRQQRRQRRPANFAARGEKSIGSMQAQRREHRRNGNHHEQDSERLRRRDLVDPRAEALAQHRHLRRAAGNAREHRGRPIRPSEDRQKVAAKVTHRDRKYRADNQQPDEPADALRDHRGEIQTQSGADDPLRRPAVRPAARRPASPRRASPQPQPGARSSTAEAYAKRRRQAPQPVTPRGHRRLERERAAPSLRCRRLGASA